MAYEINNNSGSLHGNDRKQKPNHPDFTGKAVIDGVLYYVAGWVKQGKNGEWFSLSFTDAAEADAKKQQNTASAPQRNAGSMKDQVKARRPAPVNPVSDEQHFADDDIPFVSPPATRRQSGAVNTTRRR